MNGGAWAGGFASGSPVFLGEGGADEGGCCLVWVDLEEVLAVVIDVHAAEHAPVIFIEDGLIGSWGVEVGDCGTAVVAVLREGGPGSMGYRRSSWWQGELGPLWPRRTIGGGLWQGVGGRGRGL